MSTKLKLFTGNLVELFSYGYGYYGYGYYGYGSSYYFGYGYGGSDPKDWSKNGFEAI
jgi:hypothetical protein